MGVVVGGGGASCGAALFVVAKCVDYKSFTCFSHSLSPLTVGYTFNVVLNTTMTLMIDIEHSQSSSVTACVRFALGSL